MNNPEEPIYLIFALDFSSSMRKYNANFLSKLKQEENYRKILSKLKIEINRIQMLRKINNYSRPIYISCLVYGVDSVGLKNWSYLIPHYTDGETYFEKNTIWDFCKAYSLINKFKNRLTGIDEILYQEWKDFSEKAIQNYNREVKSDSESNLKNKLKIYLEKKANTDVLYKASVFFYPVTNNKYTLATAEKIKTIINTREFNKENFMDSLVEEFINTIQSITFEIFREKGYSFESAIRERMKDFIRYNSKLIVSKSIWCENTKDILSNFNPLELEKIKNTIIQELYTKIKNEFISRIQKLTPVKEKIKSLLGVVIYKSSFKNEMEDFVKFLSVEELKRITKVLFENKFKESLTEEIENMIIYNLDCDDSPSWLSIDFFDLAINENESLFSNLKFKTKLNDKRLGDSSYYQLVLSMYDRHFKNTNNSYKKYLFQISDGGIYKENVGACNFLLSNLKKRNTKIISAITQSTVINPFPSKNYFIGNYYRYDFLFDCSSTLEELPEEIKSKIQKLFPEIDSNSKMIFSLNKEEVLEQILTAIAEEE